VQKVFTGLSQPIGVVCRSTSSLYAFQMIWVVLDGIIGVVEGFVVFLKFDVALSPVAIDDCSQVVVRLWNMRKASAVTVNGFLIFKGHEEGVSLGFHLVRHCILFYGTALYDNFGIGPRTTCSLHHFSLGSGCWLLHEGWVLCFENLLV
jgi:hypothetical protein